MKSFKAIILAAGIGSRLMPLTQNKPKCMIEVKGKSILERQLELFDKMRISKKIVVTGYLNEKIKINNCIKIINEEFDTSNMVYSLMLANFFLEGNIIISYGDIIYTQEVLETLVNDSRDVVIASDSKWKDYWLERFENPLDDAESFVKGDNKTVKSLGQIETNIDKIEGQFIGLIKLSDKGCKEIISAYNNCLSLKTSSKNAWGSKRSLKFAYMTDLLNFLAKRGKLCFNEIDRGWVEIDDLKDLEIANNISWI